MNGWSARNVIGGIDTIAHRIIITTPLKRKKNESRMEKHKSFIVLGCSRICLSFEKFTWICNGMMRPENEKKKILLPFIDNLMQIVWMNRWTPSIWIHCRRSNRKMDDRHGISVFFWSWAWHDTSSQPQLWPMKRWEKTRKLKKRTLLFDAFKLMMPEYLSKEVQKIIWCCRSNVTRECCFHPIQSNRAWTNAWNAS